MIITRFFNTACLRLGTYVMLISPIGKRQISCLAQYLPNMLCSYKFHFQEAIEALNQLQSNANYIKHAKIKNNQDNNKSEMAKYLNRSGISLDELDTLPVIHVAGTNGKGTTCSYTENILRKHGYKTGFYSSPHLLEVRERIRLNGMPISQEKFSEYFWTIYHRLDKAKNSPYDMPLYFRFITLMALHIFLAEKVDVAVLEVGIGGEYDCTNIVRNTLVGCITSLDIDHTSLLGNSIESIAWNKSGIMKPGSQVFTSVQPEAALEVLRQRSIERNCILHIVNANCTDLKNLSIPHHIQQTNASLALSISEAFINLKPTNSSSDFQKVSFNFDVAKKAIDSTRWPGRYEIIPRNNSVFYLDGAHTLDSMQVCSDWFLSKSKNNTNRRRVLVFNITGERNPENLLSILLRCHFDTVIFLPNIGHDNDSADTLDKIQPVNVQLERCYANKKIWKALDDKAVVEVVPSFAKAVRFLECDEKNRFDVLVTGSLHLIGAALSVLDPTLGGTL